MVGACAVLQHTPLAVTGFPASSLIAPPDTAEVAVNEVIGSVCTAAIPVQNPEILAVCVCSKNFAVPPIVNTVGSLVKNFLSTVPAICTYALFSKFGCAVV